MSVRFHNIGGIEGTYKEIPKSWISCIGNNDRRSCSQVLRVGALSGQESHGSERDARFLEGRCANTRGSPSREDL